MWLLTSGGLWRRPVEVSTPIHPPSVGAGEVPLAKAWGKADTDRTPSETQAAVGGFLEKPQIAGIERLQVLIATERFARKATANDTAR
jgi:hypothetical protein